MRDVKEFFDEEYKQQAQNKNYQSIASYIDGLKPTARKVIYTVIKYNINSWKKVEVLANQTAGETEYLGGSDNIAGVIVTYSKSYTTSNNVPLLETNGNFGQRLDPKPGEARYIKVRKSAETEKYFNKVDNNILIEQIFEESIVEPRFFVPTLPFILINGSDGIGSGHAQDIIPRSLANIKEYILSSIKETPLPELKPYWNGFNGTVVPGETPEKWHTLGVYEVNRRTITITELPVGYSLLQYTKKLDVLLDKKIIRSYIDESDTKSDTYRFKVQVDTKFDLSDENIIDKLKLRTKFSENYTCMDEDNSVILFDTANEVIDKYINIKLDYLQKRKDYSIGQTTRELKLLASKYIFVKNVTEGTIKVNKVKKPDIIKQIETYDKIVEDEGSYDYLLRMPIYSLTQEKLNELLAKIKARKKDLIDIKNKDIKETWIEEIEKIC